MNALVLITALRLASASLAGATTGSVALAAATPVAPTAPASVPPAARSPAAPLLAPPLPAASPPARRRPGRWHRIDPWKIVLPPHDETIRYDVRYGVFGSIGSLSVSSGALATRPGAAPTVRLQGAGGGSVLGIGSMQNRLDAEFDSWLRGSRRWTSARGQATTPTVDTGSWDGAGQASLLRRKPGAADEAYHFKAAVQTSDPLGLIWRLRTSPPPLGGSDAIQVVDGLAMWRVRVTTVAAADPVPEAAPGMKALRLEGEVAPFYYDGRPDPDRPTRHFVMWLDRSPGHVPLRIAVPLGPASVILRLVEARPNVVERGAAQVGAPAPGARSL